MSWWCIVELLHRKDDEMKTVCDHKNQLVTELLDIYSMRDLSKVCNDSLSHYMYNMPDLSKVGISLTLHVQHATPLQGRDLSRTSHSSVLYPTFFNQRISIFILNWYFWCTVDSKIIFRLTWGLSYSINQGKKYFVSLFRGDFLESLFYLCFFCTCSLTCYNDREILIEMYFDLL